MAPISTHTDKTWEYQLAEDRLEDGSVDLDGTIFELGELNVRQEADVQDSAISFGGDGDDKRRFTPGIQALRALRYGLRGWRQFPDEKGDEVKWLPVRGRPKECSEECLVHLTRAQRTEIAEAILQRTRVSVGEAD